MDLSRPSLARHLRRFFSGTLLSRISGLGRDLAMAAAFGGHPSVAAFMVAFRLSHLLRRLLGEGPFQSAFIPHFEAIRLQNPPQALTFFRRLTALGIWLLLAITLGVEVLLALLLQWGGLSSDNQEIVRLTAYLFPGILFICLYGLNLSFLHCHGAFFTPSFAPFICNVIWIASALWLRAEDPHLAMPTLALWVVVGFFGQWLLTLPPTLRRMEKGAWREWFSWRIPQEVKELAKAFSLGAIGVGAVQINGVIDTFFARFSDLSGPVYLWFSIRIEQLALAVFGIACVSTIVPSLSRAIKEGNKELAESLFSLSLNRILAIMIPCTFALFILGGPTVNLLYGRGHFSTLAVTETSLCLFAYAIGLVPTTLVMLYSAIFYAGGDFKTPMKVAIASVGVSAALNALFIFGFGFGALSTALATSLCAFLNSLVLRKGIERLGWKVDLGFRKVAAYALLSAVAGSVALFVEQYFCFPSVVALLTGLETEWPRALADQLARLALPGGAFLGVLGAAFLGYRVWKRGEAPLSL